MRVWALLLCAALSCGRCSGHGAPDAGRPRATDVRTALMTVFPEFRGAAVRSGFFRLTREYQWSGSLDAALSGVSSTGFSRADGGQGLVGRRPPFELFAHQSPGRLELTLRLPVTDEDVSHIFQSPAPLSTEAMERLMPAPAGARLLREEFSLALEYVAVREARAAFLCHQLIDVLTTGGWRTGELPRGYQKERQPDGGIGAVPERFTVRLTRADPPAAISLSRDGANVQVEISEPLFP